MGLLAEFNSLWVIGLGIWVSLGCWVELPSTPCHSGLSSVEVCITNGTQQVSRESLPETAGAQGFFFKLISFKMLAVLGLHLSAPTLLWGMWAPLLMEHGL